MVSHPFSVDKTSQPHNLQRNAERLRDLEMRFNERLIGQEEAVHEVYSLLKCLVTGFFDENVPYGVLLFAGPTGVGKTELAKMIAEELALPFLRYDMSEFSERQTVSSLLGAPPGYTTCEMQGRLVKDLQEYPVAVVLFDEIEKAHPHIFPTFLQLFGEGRLTDRTGNHVFAKSNLFIMTTNLGSSIIQQQITSSSKTPLIKILKPLFIKKFTPEFYNRIQKTIVFQPISQETICKITNLFFGSLAKDIFRRKKIVLRWTIGAIQYFARVKHDPGMGARGLHRRIRNAVLPLLADICIIEKISEGDTIRLKTCQKGTILKVGRVFRKNMDTIGQQSHTSSSEIYSSPHYDFHLPPKPPDYDLDVPEESRKRKLIALTQPKEKRNEIEEIVGHLARQSYEPKSRQSKSEDEVGTYRHDGLGRVRSPRPFWVPVLDEAISVRTFNREVQRNVEKTAVV